MQVHDSLRTYLSLKWQVVVEFTFQFGDCCHSSHLEKMKKVTECFSTFQHLVVMANAQPQLDVKQTEMIQMLKEPDCVIV